MKIGFHSKKRKAAKKKAAITAAAVSAGILGLGAAGAGVYTATKKKQPKVEDTLSDVIDGE